MADELEMKRSLKWQGSIQFSGAGPRRLVMMYRYFGGRY